MDPILLQGQRPTDFTSEYTSSLQPYNCLFSFVPRFPFQIQAIYRAQNASLNRKHQFMTVPREQSTPFSQEVPYL